MIEYRDYMEIFAAPIERLRHAVRKAREECRPEEYGHAVRLLIHAVLCGEAQVSELDITYDLGDDVWLPEDADVERFYDAANGTYYYRPVTEKAHRVFYSYNESHEYPGFVGFQVFDPADWYELTSREIARPVPRSVLT